MTSDVSTVDALTLPVIYDHLSKIYIVHEKIKPILTILMNYL